MMDYQQFLSNLQHRGSKPHKIGHCLGTRDAYKWVRKNKWSALDGIPCNESMYSKIINAVNKSIIEHLLEGHSVALPYRMGELSIESRPTEVKFDNGKIRDNYLVDWQKTLQYWYEDKEALKAHKRIKRMQKYLYLIKYSSRGANYRYKNCYDFRVNRSLAKLITQEGSRRKMAVGIEHN